MNLDTLRQVASAEALAYLEQLGLSLDEAASAVLAGVVAEEVAASLLAAKIVLIDKALKLLDGIEKAVASGVIPPQWQRGDLPQALVTTGLTRYDPRIAFQAGLRSAYSAGRYERGMKDDGAQFWLYRTMRDGRVRNSHAVLNGVALPKGDAFWDTHFPPNGWRCRCKAYAIDQAGIDRLQARGLKVQTQAPQERMVEHENKTTGERETLPASVEPGWGFNPARNQEQLARLLVNRQRLLNAD